MKELDMGIEIDPITENQTHENFIKWLDVCEFDKNLVRLLKRLSYRVKWLEDQIKSH